MMGDELIVNPGRNKVTALLEYITCYSIVLIVVQEVKLDSSGC